MSRHEQCPYQDGRVVIDPAFKADAPARYARLRELGPIHPAEFHLGLKGWVVVGHELAREALTHPALLKDATPAAEALAAAGYVLHKPSVGLGAQMMEADPPAHTRLRRLASAAFTPRRTADLAPRIEQIAHGLIDALPPAGETDLVEVFNAPLPATVIAELLGIPEEHHLDFRRWSAQALQVASPGHRQALAGLHGLLAGLVADKRRSPGDDLLSALVAVRDEDDGRLTEEELVGTAMMLVVAGHESTVNLLGNALLALLQHPEQLRLLRERPELMPGAVEEFLRYDTSVERSTSRYAAEDLELGGVSVPRGGMVVVALGAAGRDAPQSRAEDPGVLDVTRPGARHLAFGHGVHYCLGAPLARLEAAIALRTLLGRLPELELSVPVDSLQWIGSGIIRGVLSLPVRYRSV
ncbi:cytochrome P450 [Streptomyces cocklensis]|uniref:Cytochrome P450 monooxygenase PikC n=1 Tax=Actinacidiphila cocklensis TaxID=887465 RepID=A0A9W4DNJ9_9ACTN|nr:cytochrome P450 [Actinacidiphila cocklensis]MDD1058527.1 cytochrome P450 [Actinacidiphila cocklensis]CAG6390694.1 Cytochrome P450 monooxygenase PikC [Actinacidiphila cocklensis]